MKAQRYRVTLSGIGGEEATAGGRPSPRLELQNLLARAQFFTLARQLSAWAAKTGRPHLPLLWEAVRGFLVRARVGVLQDIYPSPWFARDFVRRNRAALCGYSSRVKLFGPLPSFQDHIYELNHTRRVLASCGLRSEWLQEARFPYVDRDLLEFAYAIPREQLVRVGQRRSLMRRALVGIVPDELLNRKRKAAVQQGAKEQRQTQGTPTEWACLVEIGKQMVGGAIGIIHPNRFFGALEKARRNEEVPIGSLKRTLKLECWLRHLTTHRVLTDSTSTRRRGHSSAFQNARSAQKFS